MTDQAALAVDMDWSAFDPWRIQPFKHALMDHPLLQTEQLVELGKRCRGTTRWYAFNSDVTAGTDFDDASQLFPTSRSAVDSLRDIGSARAWVLLRHIQADPLYRELVDAVIDPMKPLIERKDPAELAAAKKGSRKVAAKA